MFVIMMFVLLFCTVVELFEYGLQLRRDRKTKMGRILDEGYTLVGNVEENDGGTDYGAGADNLSVQNVAYAYKGKDQHLLEDALEANRRGQLLIDNGAHDAGDVVDDHKGQKCIQ